MCSVHADATAFTYLTLLVPVVQFTIVDEPSWSFGGINLDVGFSLHSLHKTGHQLSNNFSL